MPKCLKTAFFLPLLSLPLLETFLGGDDDVVGLFRSLTRFFSPCRDNSSLFPQLSPPAVFTVTKLAWQSLSGEFLAEMFVVRSLRVHVLLLQGAEQQVSSHSVEAKAKQNCPQTRVHLFLFLGRTHSVVIKEDEDEAGLTKLSTVVDAFQRATKQTT